MANDRKIPLKKLDSNRYLIEKHGAMRVDGLIFIDEELLKILGTDESIKQVENVACLPGIVSASMAMPDIHWGYGFPIGGVAAFDTKDGVICPGGVGYDINCGVRLIRSTLTVKEMKNLLSDIIDNLFFNIPSGIGSHRKDLRLSRDEISKVLRKGAKWAIEKGYGDDQDLHHIEDNGEFPQANPDYVSDRAYQRGKDQLGTVGSGNHFVEVGRISEIYDEKIASAFGLFKDQITVMVHSGSRGLGYQVCDDYIREMMKASEKYGIFLSRQAALRSSFSNHRKVNDIFRPWRQRPIMPLRTAR